jgi:hypothetical protein
LVVAGGFLLRIRGPDSIEPPKKPLSASIVPLNDPEVAFTSPVIFAFVAVNNPALLQ